MEKLINVAIDRMGKADIEVEGCTDSSCADITAPLEAALANGGPIDVAYKPEFYQQKGNTVEQELRRM